MLNDFEIMVYADCRYRSSELQSQFFGAFSQVRDVMSIPAYLMSLLAGFLILRQSWTKSPYPSRFIACICLFQAMAVYAYNFDDYDFCDSWQVNLLHNSMVSKGSNASGLLRGSYLSTMSQQQLAGALIIGNTMLSKVAVYSEQLFTVLLNLDVIQTLKNPLDRSAKLAKLRKIMQIGIFLIIFICLSCIPFIIRKVQTLAPLLSRKAEDYEEQNIKNLLRGNLTIDLQLRTFFNYYSMLFNLLYFSITFYAVIICVNAYAGKMSFCGVCSWISHLWSAKVRESDKSIYQRN